MSKSQEQLQRSALAYLAKHQVMTLATVGDSGPWAAAVFYANQEFEFYFLSSDQTRHVQDLSIYPRAAVTIQRDYEDWPAIKGIQMEGEVSKLSGTDRKGAIDLYQSKFPFIISAGAQIQTALKRVSWFRFEPEKLYFIDNSRGLGHRDLIDLNLEGHSFQSSNQE